MEQLLIIRDFIRTLMRRFLLFAFVVAVGTTASVFYALSLDRIYEASAVVQIQGPQISTDTSDEPAASSTAQRIQQIEQQLRSRDSLFEVAEKYELFGAADLTTADRVALMRETVQLERVAGVQTGYGQAPEPSALIITAQLGDAEKAALVANEFVSRLLERNLAQPRAADSRYPGLLPPRGTAAEPRDRRTRHRTSGIQARECGRAARGPGIPARRTGSPERGPARNIAPDAGTQPRIRVA